MGNPVYKYYNYGQEPGDLIDFTPETKYESFEKQVISNTSIDPKTGITSNFESFLEMMNNFKTFPEIINDKTITVEERKKLIKEFVVNMMTYKKYGAKRLQFNATVGGYGWESNYNDRDIPINVSKSDYLAKAAGGNVVFILDGEPNLTPAKIPIGSIVLYTYPLDTPEDAAHRDDNIFRKLQMELEEANIIIDGDPYIMSEQVVGIGNVQREHVGKYYIKKCEHQISQMGYKTTLETTRVKDEAIVKSLRTDYTSTIDQEELGEIYLKQQRLFAKWDIQLTMRVESFGLASTPGQISHKTMDDIFNDQTLGGNSDMIADMINQYLDDNRNTFTVEENPFVAVETQ
jgi:hypothetical protein